MLEATGSMNALEGCSETLAPSSSAFGLTRGGWFSSATHFSHDIPPKATVPCHQEQTPWNPSAQTNIPMFPLFKLYISDTVSVKEICVGLYRCMHSCVCSRLLLCVHVCTDIQELEVDIRCPSQSFSPLFTKTVFFKERRLCCLVSLAGLQAVGTLRPLPLRAGITGTFRLVGTGDSNSGSYACTASPPTN